MGIEFLKKMNEAMPDGIKRRFSFLIRRCLVANDSFLDQYRLLDKLSAASADERLSYQRDQLRGILSFAEANVSYYRKLFHEGGFDPRRLSDVSDLKKLPILTRQTIKENFDDLQALSISDHYEVTTGGSSGEPLRVCLDRPSIYRERAFIYHFWAEHGYDYRSSRIATFRGVDFDGKLVKSNPLYNEIQLNPFFLREDNVASYVKAIEESKADFLHGYPSAIAHFCHLLRKTNHHLKCPLQAVFFVSEDAYAKHYEIVREVLGCEAWAFYGHSERAVFAEQVAFVPEGPLYRFDPLYGVAEIVEHSEGNIVCTGFLNRRMPLIRYAMDDWATLDQGKDSLIAISGHHTDLAFVGLQGEQITQTALNFHDGTFEGIEAYQLVQCRRGEAECRIRSIEPLAADDLDRISRSLISKTGTAIKWTVVQNTPFELTERGKCKTIVSLLGGGGVDILNAHDEIYRFKISGHRNDAVLIGKNGERISQTMINFHDSTFDLIEAYQFVQDNDGKAECRLRASRRLDAADIADIASALYSKTGDSIIWSVCQDVPFELTPRGKCKTVVQRVPKNRSIS